MGGFGPGNRSGGGSLSEALVGTPFPTSSPAGAVGEQLRETQHINRSLFCLRDVIAALGSHARFVPFRNSKLTWLLKDGRAGPETEGDLGEGKPPQIPPPSGANFE